MMDRDSLPASRTTILIVDDDANLRRCMRLILEKEGFRVLEYASAREALAALALTDFDVSLVISDVNMPGLNGVEFASIIGKTLPRLPVLLISGTAINAPGVPFLAKPFTAHTLKASVDSLLAKSVPQYALAQAS